MRAFYKRQRPVLFSAFAVTYAMSMVANFADRNGLEGWKPGDWIGADLLVLPMLIAARRYRPHLRRDESEDVGCSNKLMTMLDTETGKIVATVPIGAGVDACAFDDSTQLAFASCGDGTTTIAKEETPEKLTVIQTLKTERGARTMALDPETHRIYLPSAQFEPVPSPPPGSSPARPKIVPNTLKLLVYAPVELSKP
jgi:hypothetical protein